MSDPREPQDGGGEPPVDDELDLGILDDDDPEPDIDPEPEPEPQDADQPEDLDEPPRRQTRRERQAGNRDRVAQLEAENAEVRRRLAEIEGTRNQPPPVDPMAEQRRMEAEYERLAMLPPQDMVREMHQMVRREFGAGLQAVSAQTLERADIAAFDALKRSSPVAARLAPQVEQTAADLRRQGVQGINREMLLAYHVGQEVLQRARGEGARQRRTGAANVARQTVRPGSGRGNMARVAGNGRGGDADRALLESLPPDF